MKGFVLKKLVSHKAVRLTLIAILLAVPALFLFGCTAGQVVAPFNPKEVKPEPYTPEPEWSDKTDVTLTSIESMKKQAGQTVAPGASGSTSGATTGPGGTTPGSVTPITPSPTPPTPVTPAERTPSMADPVYGIVRDRVEGGVIPNATVTLKERRGNIVSSFITNINGEYSFTGIGAGYYNVSVTAAGYLPCPLSSRDFFYVGNPIQMDLQLVTNYPWQMIEGIYYSYRGTVSVPGSWNPTTFPVPPLTRYVPESYFSISNDVDVMPAPFWSAGPEQTWNAAIFDEGGPYDPNPWPATQRRPAWVQYDFTVPAPDANHYAYDGLWVKTPNSYMVGTNNVWSAGGNASIFYFDWVLNTWVYDGTTANTTWVQPDFSAVQNGTGRVSVRMFAADANPFVLTQARLEYDYRKDTDLPTLSGTYVDGFSGGPAIYTAFVTAQVQENAIVTITVTGPGAPDPPAATPVETHHGIYYFSIGNLQTAGVYQYTIRLDDQGGNPSQTYGPYTITVP